MNKTQSAKLEVQNLNEAISGMLDVNQISRIMLTALIQCLEIAKKNQEITAVNYVELNNVLRRIALKMDTELDEFSTRRQVVNFHNKTLNNYFYMVHLFKHPVLINLLSSLHYTFLNFRIRWYWSSHAHSSMDAEIKFIDELYLSNYIVE